MSDLPGDGSVELKFFFDSRSAGGGSVTPAPRVIVALLLLAGVSAPVTLAGSVAAAAQARASSAEVVNSGIAWTSCGRRLQCARVRVPLNWDRPRGPKIELGVIRHLASRPGKRIGSLFVNPGGPGDTGVGLVRNSGAELDAMGRGRFDVVSWDPRGTNASTHVRCFNNRQSLDRFWKGQTIPITTQQSR